MYYIWNLNTSTKLVRESNLNCICDLHRFLITRRIFVFFWWFFVRLFVNFCRNLEGRAKVKLQFRAPTAELILCGRSYMYTYIIICCTIGKSLPISQPPVKNVWFFFKNFVLSMSAFCTSFKNSKSLWANAYCAVPIQFRLFSHE